MTSSARPHLPLRIAGSVVLILICLLGALIAASGIQLTYYLPPVNGSGGMATRHTTTFGPAIAATITVVIFALTEIVWLVWNLVSVPPRWFWIGAALIAVIAIIVGVSANELPRPSF
ncbi:hypothetical protein FOE78_15540 [Microlunatus elymi]|uniref:Uncharacterized protein n=1 Tax=Microlunatus elymi TaxID=2596828 RepID=A0A516Q140_9ACTN|nr:hypothetical protein [Microlunatus elymi]QDP97150.1 hypothetical protein FOE78_15540 [Microlunatus elymi]